VYRAPALVACSHGTRDAAGQRAIDQLRESVSALRPGTTVIEAYVDLQEPELSEVLKDIGPAVVVPVLLSSGYHVHVDISGAVAAAGPQVRKSGALGPDTALVDVLAERLDEASVSPDHAIVLAAAGSSDHRAVTDIEQTTLQLTRRLGRPVVTAYASAAEPRVTQAVEQLRAQGHPVAVASYLLAQGFFYDQLAAAGADVVTAPLLPHPAIAELVLCRYDEAVRGG
jgi:sirohydrochlorin ferrochelatase